MALFEQTTKGGVHFWKLARFPLFHAVATCLGLFDVAAPRKSVSRKNANRRGGALSNSVLFVRKRYDTAIVEHPRKILDYGCYIDPYTNLLATELRISGQSIIMLESGEYGHRNPDRTDRSYYGDSFPERAARAVLSRIGDPMGLRASECAMEALNAINRFFSLKINFNFARKVENFLIQRQVFRRFFVASGCRQAYLVCAYGKEPIIAAAQEQGVETIELQHGVINPIHPGYSFGSSPIPYFPDQILFFGEKWFTDTIPIPPNKASFPGFPRLNEIASKIKPNRSDNNILFISQPTTNSNLLACAIAVAQSCPDLSITFKFHPRESDETVSAARNSYSPIRFLRDEESLYELFANSAIVVGVYSFALLEAAALGCGLLLIRAPGIESIAGFIDDMRVTVAEDTAEAVSILKGDRHGLLPQGNINGWFNGMQTMQKA